MSLLSFDTSAMWRKLRELEKNLAFDNNPTPLFGSMMQPMEGARRVAEACGSDIFKRVDRVKAALDLAPELALQMLQADFADLNLELVWGIFKGLLQDVALYVGGCTAAGTVLGAGLGALAGGVGAIPGAAAGGTLGFEVGTIVLNVIGIAALMEMVFKYMPQVIEYYQTGMKMAWGPDKLPPLSNSGMPVSNSSDVRMAAMEVAKGHKILIYALLMGMVAYLLRSGGSAQKLMAEVAANSRLGPKLAQWIAKNEQKLLNNPRLRETPNRGPTRDAGGGGNTTQGKGGEGGQGGQGNKGGQQQTGSGNKGSGKGGEGNGSKGDGKNQSAAEEANGKAKKGCACPGGAVTANPVDAIFGCKILSDTELDFALPAPLPLIWQRSYSSDNPHTGYLGQGWSTPLSLALEMRAHDITVLDGQHRCIRFPHLQEGEEFYSPYEQITLTRLDTFRYTLLDKDARLNSFILPSPSARIARLTEIADRNNNRISIEYDQRQLPGRVTDSAGRQYSLIFDERKRLSAVQLLLEDGAPTNLVSYEYDAHGDLVKVRNRAGDVSREFAYREHILIMHAQPGGLVSHYEYDEYTPFGKVLRNTTNSGQSWRLAYGRQQTQVSDNLGRNIRHRFNADKRHIGSIDALGGQTRIDLDAHGNPLAVTDPAGNTTRYSYDKKSRLLSVQDAEGGLTQLRYDDQSGAPEQPVSITNALGHSTQLRYDSRGNVLEVCDALGQRTQYEYDERGLAVRIVDARGGNKQISYNAAGQVLSYTDCSGQVTRFSYDPFGNLLESVDALGQRTCHQYDAAGRLQETQYADGAVEKFTYDHLGRLVQHTDPNGRATHYHLDGEGRLLARENAQGGKLAYAYDQAKRLVQLINENGAVYAFNYDALDRLTQETGFDLRTTRYHYDAAGFTTVKQELGCGEFAPPKRSGEELAGAAQTEHLIETRLERDKNGRLLHKIVSAAGKESLETWYGYDALGRLNNARNAQAQIELEYDALHRLQSESCLDLQNGDRSYLQHSYDALGNRTQTILPDGRVLNNLYYGSGHLHQINLDGEVISDIERDSLHREIWRSQGQLASRFAYDPLGRLRRQLVARGVTAEILPDPKQAAIAREYEYDKTGNLLKLQDKRAGQSSYEYDQIGRITRAQQGNVEERFAFDPAHNLLDADSGQALGGNRLQVYGDKRYSYDAHGNLEQKKTARHSQLELNWTLEHQLQSSRICRNLASDHPLWQEAHYRYDPFGRRMEKRDQFGVSRFIWDGNRLLQESRGSHCRTYIYAGMGFVPLAQVDSDKQEAGAEEAPTASSNIHYIHTDHLGTPRELSDSAGNIAWAASYKLWGNVWQVEEVGEVGEMANSLPQTLPQALRFQGQYFDSETGLHYNRFRYYDPDIGRFISQDPIGLRGGNNLYQYAANPVGWVDPLGLAGNPATATHIMYQGIDAATGKPYIGYASMQGHKLPAEVLDYRYSGNFSRFGGQAPEILYSGYGQEGKDIARGLEQRTFEKFGGLKGTANAQNPVGIGNERRDIYLKAADEHLAKSKCSC